MTWSRDSSLSGQRSGVHVKIPRFDGCFPRLDANQFRFVGVGSGPRNYRIRSEVFHILHVSYVLPRCTETEAQALLSKLLIEDLSWTLLVERGNNLISIRRLGV